MTIIIGIDPGATGAIAYLTNDGALISVHDMPYSDGHVLAPILAGGIAHIAQCPPTLIIAYVERAQSMPGMGVSGAFRYGAGYGTILGVLGALHIPTHTVPPSVWKRAQGLSKDKGASRRRATELWPTHAEAFARVKDDGRAEAALIALWGQSQGER